MRWKNADIFAVAALIAAIGAAPAFTIKGAGRVFSFDGGLTGQFCRSLVFTCLHYLPIAAKFVFIAAAALTAAGFLNASIRLALRVRRSNRAVKGLPLLQRPGLSVSIIKDISVKAAFTHGFFTPRIYVSEGLIKALSREELRCVLLHEAHHARRRDPLKFAALCFVKDFFFYAPPVKTLAKRLVERCEDAADSSAAASTGRPLDLASAIVKTASRQYPGAAMLREKTCVERRIIRLINGYDPDVEGGGSVIRMLTAAAGAAVITFALLLPAAALPPKSEAACTMAHCEKHSSGMNDDCKKHCSSPHGGDFRSQHVHTGGAL